jgi:hypothetical protein
MAAALQSAATTGHRGAELAIDRQRTGAAAAALFGPGNAIAWIAFLLSAKAVGLKPPVVGKLAQTYDYLHATVPLFVPLALVLSVIGIFVLLFVRALDERFRTASPALSWLASLCGVAGVLILELDFMSFFFVQERMVLGSDRPAVEALIPGFSVLAPVAALLASLFLAAWIGLISRISRGPAGLPRALRYPPGAQTTRSPAEQLTMSPIRARVLRGPSTRAAVGLCRRRRIWTRWRTSGAGASSPRQRAM